MPFAEDGIYDDNNHSMMITVMVTMTMTRIMVMMMTLVMTGLGRWIQ